MNVVEAFLLQKTQYALIVNLKMKTFLSEADSSVTVESLAESTGVSLKNVNRFLQDKNVYTTLTNLGLNSEANKIHNISL